MIITRSLPYFPIVVVPDKVEIRPFDANDRDKWSKGCGLSETSGRIVRIGGRDKRGREGTGGAKERGVECGGQSIIKPALSLLGSVNGGRGPRKKRKKRKRKREDAA